MRKVKLGIIGLGSFGQAQHLVSATESKSVDLMMGCDLNEENCKKVSEQYGIPCITSLDEFLANDEIEAVSIAVHDQAHCDTAVRALAAGKHVLCEKPMALTLEECQTMIAASKQYNRLLMVGQVARFSTMCQKAMEIFKSGEVGELYYIETEYAHDYSHLSPSWRRDPNSPRPGIIGGGCHAVDRLRYFAGDPIEVFAYSNHKTLLDWPTDDCSLAIMKFPNDVIGKVHSAIGAKTRNLMRTAIYCTKGTIIFDNSSSSVRVFKDEINGTHKLFDIDTKITEVHVPLWKMEDHNVTKEYDILADCIVNGTKLEMSGEEGAKTVAVCRAIVESADKHEIIKMSYNF